MVSVLTGDIAGSTQLSSGKLDDTIDAIADAADVIRQWPDIGKVIYARRAGDAWQIALEADKYTLRACLYIYARVRSLDKDRTTRIAIAKAPGEIMITNPNQAHGQAFINSGRLTEIIRDKSQKSSRLVFDHAGGGAVSACFIFAGDLADGWTDVQARAFAEQLQPNPITREQIAAKNNVSRQAINQALWSSGYRPIKIALKNFETEINFFLNEK